MALAPPAAMDFVNVLMPMSAINWTVDHLVGVEVVNSSGTVGSGGLFSGGVSLLSGSTP